MKEKDTREVEKIDRNIKNVMNHFLNMTMKRSRIDEERADMFLSIPRKTEQETRA